MVENADTSSMTSIDDRDRVMAQLLTERAAQLIRQQRLSATTRHCRRKDYRS